MQRALDETKAIEVSFRNLQRRRRINTPLLHQITSDLIKRLLCLDHAEVGFQLVTSRRMSQVNWDYLKHEGPTDVITFGYPSPSRKKQIHGDVFICIDVAESQSKEFRTTWQQELVRYLVHGVLHLLGFDDHQPTDRRTMKRQENRLVRQLETSWDLASIELTPILPNGRS